MRFRLALLFALLAGSAHAQVTPGTSPLSGAKGGTNNAFMQFTGPAGSMKTFTLPNVSDTLVTLLATQTLSNKTLVAPTLGTPVSVVLTNATGTAAGLTAGHVTTNANSTGDVTSVGNATTIANNVVTNAKLAQGAAATFKGNPTAATAAQQDFTVQGLANLASPSSTLDFIPIYDHATGLIKNVTPGAIASSSVAGVSSIDTATGNFTISGLLARSSQNLQVVAAAKTDQQTGTSNVLAVTPLHQQDHDSSNKAWVNFTGSATNGAQTINSSYNVSAVTRTSLGTYTVTISPTPFANTSYACHVSARISGINGWGQTVASGLTASSLPIQFITLSGGALAAFDPANGEVTCVGRQ